MVPVIGGNVKLYPASNVSGALRETPSVPDAVNSLNVIVFALLNLTSSLISIPLSVIDILLSLFTTAVIAAEVLSDKSSTVREVLPSNTRFVISCTVLSSLSKYTLPSAVLIANSPEFN